MNATNVTLCINVPLIREGEEVPATGLYALLRESAAEGKEEVVLATKTEEAALAPQEAKSEGASQPKSGLAAKLAAKKAQQQQ